MAGVAEKGYVAVSPVRQRIAIEDRPFVHVRAGRKDSLDFVRKTGEGGAQFLDVALGRPGLDAKLRLRLAGDEVDLAAVRLDVIDDDVPVLAPPFGTIVDHLAAQQGRGVSGPVGDAAGVFHRRRAEQDISHHRMHAVCADDGVGSSGCAIGKAQPYAVAGLVESDQPVAKLDALVGNGARERRMQVSAMRQQIRRAKLPFGGFAEDHVELDVAGAPIAVVPGTRIEGLLAHFSFKPEFAQNLHGVAADLDSGAQSRKLRGLLVDRYLDADPPERRGGRQPAHAGADNRNPERPCHRFTFPKIIWRASDRAPRCSTLY